MIRMTLLLVAALGAVMIVFGERADLPQGGYDPDDVSRADTAGSGLTNPVLVDRSEIPLDDEEEALRRALAASIPADALADPAETEAPAPLVREASLEPVTVPRDLWIVTGNRVNLRAGPSTGNAVVDQVVLGQEAEVLEEMASGWMQIRVRDTGVEGYIFGRFIAPL